MEQSNLAAYITYLVVEKQGRACDHKTLHDQLVQKVLVHQ